MKITEFSSLYCKEASRVMDAAEWVEEIRNGKHKSTVEGIRALVAEGRKEDASRLKLKLPAVVIAGVCRTGRFYKNTTERTGWTMLDMDNMTPQQLQAARKLLEVYPWVVMLHVTSSGRGLRIVVNMGMVHIDVYRDAYERIAGRLREITGMEPDMACKDFARASLASYDPEIYYNPEAEVFDYGTEANPLNYVPAAAADCTEDFRIPKTVAGCRTGGAGADVQGVIDRFFSTHSYSAGSRHNTLLKLGGYMKWRGIEPWQMDDAVARACSVAVEPGITEKEVRAAVMWGYENGKEGERSAPYTVQRGQSAAMYPAAGTAGAENAGRQGDDQEEEDEDEFVKRNCVPFPDSVFEGLPQELKDLLVVARDRRERDVILLSCITVLSGLFPALRTVYGNQKNSAHLYSCFVASAGSGKGVATYSTRLGRKVHEELERIYLTEKRVYESKLLEWEMEVRTAFKEKRKPDMELKPVEPLRRMFFLHTNTSKSQLLHDMAAAEMYGYGPVLWTTEIDALAEALNTDYGKHASELRMFFHHESVGQRFKTDKEPVEITSPKLALMMSGTPEQLVRFIKSIEDGMYSRFLFYMMSPNLKWKSQSPLDGNGDIDVDCLFGKLADKLKVNFFDSLGKEIMINFTRGQWDMHERAFSRELGIVAAENNPNTAAIVFRAGLIVLRIAMVFCGLRIMEAGWQVTEYSCSDEDFCNALDIVITSMRHTAFISTMMNETAGRKRITNFYKFLPILKGMKNRFRFCEFRDGVIKAGFSDTAAKRALRKYLENGLISRTQEGYEKTSLLKAGYKGEM